MFIYSHIMSYYKLYFNMCLSVSESLMFIYSHIMSYYKLYFIMCLSVSESLMFIYIHLILTNWYIIAICSYYF